MKRPTIFLLLSATFTILTVATKVATSISDPTLQPTYTTTKRQQPVQQPQFEQNAAEMESSGSRRLEPSGGQKHQRISRASSVKQIRHRTNESNRTSSQSTTLRLKSEQKPMTTTTKPPPISGIQAFDPLELAQQQAKLMMGYNNTPPLFITDTRDLFIDVARQPLGTTIKTIKAIDLDGDTPRLEYSLQPANLHDASPYFSINSTSGELKLANRSFKFHTFDMSPSTQKLEKATDNDDDCTNPDGCESSDENEDEADPFNEGGSSQDESSLSEEQGSFEDQRLVSRNRYFLNVAVDDGRYTSVVELQIHILNSSSFAATTGAGFPVQLTPEGSRKALDEQLPKLIQRKTEEFYNKLHRTPTNYTTNNNSGGSSSTVVYPNFVNPGLVRPVASTDSSNEFTINETTTSLPNMKQSEQESSTTSSSISSISPTTQKSSDIAIDSEGIVDTSSLNSISINSLVTRSPLADHNKQLPSNEPLVPQPMIVSLVLICSFLMICMVLLMFIVPISVKQLRKRLKHVELQHEHLSQQNSNRSSTVCSSSSTTSSTRNHVPSLSQFTLNSARSSDTGASSVCRKSSLDSASFGMPPPLFGGVCRPLNRINNGSIANPVYLQQQQQYQHQQQQQPQQQQVQGPLQHQVPSFVHQGPQIIKNQTFLSHGTRCQLVNGQQAVPAAQRCDNIYCPIDDDGFYSTINTDGNILNAASNAVLMDNVRHQAPIMGTNLNLDYLERPIESRNSDSDSSTRSLARFLSLPARHSSHVQQKTADPGLEGCPVDQIFRQVTSKTIARATNIERDQRHSSGADWELDRYKLKFLDILDEGQFGQVWRCNLKQNDGSDRVVAVKTLKNKAMKDERGREELLAEIEIMKLVCKHANVVKILHCCTSNDLFSGESKPILLVMEYVELGKLQSYLENSRINHNYATNQYNNNNNNNQAMSNHLTSRDLVKFIYHVAEGMEYISSQWIVHRDLASRNILVSSQRICKIGDFGMARHIGGIYERHSRNTKIPVRWMAPEVLLENQFTTKSDVFSFGILMWEIVTLGSTPYRHLETEQVIEKVARNGERPCKPEYCHAELYKIMSQCWHHEPDERPTFRKLVKQLDELLLSANDYIELDQYPDHNYYNTEPQAAAPNELL